jgi:glutaredoxin-like protein
MNLLNKKTIAELEKIFGDFKGDVSVKYFGDDPAKESRFCRETRQLIEGVAKISDKISLTNYDFNTQKDAVAQFDIQRVPALVVMDEQDYGIRFYGVPSGYEFSSLIESFKLIASGETLLVQETRDFLDTLAQDIHLQVFVTPTCPHCPTAVVLAHRMAYYSSRVKADMIEATEYPELAQKYSVMGVPRTIINETGFQEGAAPEDRLVERIKATLG